MPAKNNLSAERKRIIANWAQELESHISGLAEVRESRGMSRSHHDHLEKLIELARGFLTIFDKLDDEVSKITKQAAVGTALFEVLRDHSDEPALAWKAFVQSETDRLDPENAGRAEET